MADTQNFRTAFSGFNREDVVRFIESLNNKYKTTEGELREEVARLEQELKEARKNDTDVGELDACRAELSRLEAEAAEKQEAYERKIAELEQQVKELREAKVVKSRDLEQEELEIYRRAERTERLAKERVKQMYVSANGILDDVQQQMKDRSREISQTVDEVAVKLVSLQDVLGGSAGIAENAVEALKALHLDQD